MNVEPLESTFITSLTTAPRGTRVVHSQIRRIFQEGNWFEFKPKSNPNPNSIQLQKQEQEVKKSVKSPSNSSNFETSTNCCHEKFHHVEYEKSIDRSKSSATCLNC